MGSLRTLRKLKGEIFPPEETSHLISEQDKEAERIRLSHTLASLNRQLTSNTKAKKRGLWIAGLALISMVFICIGAFFNPFSWIWTVTYFVCMLINIYTLKSVYKEHSYCLNEIKMLKEKIQSTEEQIKGLT